MVPLATPGGLRVVLTWAMRPYDLDLWVVKALDPLPDFQYAVFWGQRNLDGSLISDMRGIQLDRDQKVSRTLFLHFLTGC